MDISILHDLDELGKNSNYISNRIKHSKEIALTNDEEGLKNQLNTLEDECKKIRLIITKIARSLYGDQDIENHDGPIFMGNGGSSGLMCSELHEKLDTAFSHLSGLQQGVAGGEAEIATNEIELTARLIVRCLTGKEIKFAKNKVGK